MATSEFENALKELIELSYDIVEAYEVAIDRIESGDFRRKLNDFLLEHNYYIRKLSASLKEHNITPPDGPDVTKQRLTKGKVVLSNISGNKVILAAMSSNETDMGTAYEKLLSLKRDDKWEDAADTVDDALKDQQKHKVWFEVNE